MAVSKEKEVAQSPLMLRAHRLMDAFSKSDDERDFYLDRHEGFLLFADLDASQEELDGFEEELCRDRARYEAIPKLTFYETKKIMEGFVNEKVYDIDTKEKLLDIIGSREARERFLEFLHDHPNELDKWQQYYQERFRVRIIEWLRSLQLRFVFEEDVDLPASMMEKLKRQLFQSKVAKEIAQGRKTLETKAETYYSNEALNPRPKRGRPPKQQVKVEVEPTFSDDVYLTVPPVLRPFLFIPEISSFSSITFSAKYGNQEELLAKIKHGRQTQSSKLEELANKLASLKNLSAQVAARKASLLVEAEEPIDDEPVANPPKKAKAAPKKEAAPKKPATAPKKKAKE